MPDEDQNTQPNESGGFTPEPRPPLPADPQPTSPINEPSTQPQSLPQPTVSGQPQKPSRKKFIVGGIIAAILVALLGGGALAYTMYQSPEKVLSDSIINLTQMSGNMSGTASIEVANDDVSVTIEAGARGDGNIVNGDAKLSIDFKSEELQPIGTIAASADYAASDDGVWLKLNDVSDVVNKALDAYIDNLNEQYADMGFDISDEEIESQKSLMLAQIQPVLDKINNRWIKLDSDDSDDQDNSSQCMLDAVKAAASDRSQRDELTKVYDANQFIIVKEKLGTKDGNLGYKLDFDEAKAEAFSKAVEDTSLGKALLECDPDAFADDATITEDSEAMSNSDVEVWIGQWDHKLKRAVVTGTTEENTDNPTSVRAEVTLNYDKVDGLSTPEDAITIEELQAEIQGLMGGTPALEL